MQTNTNNVASRIAAIAKANGEAAPVMKINVPVTVTFKWGVSRGRDTYGYNICSMYVGDKKVSSCKGGGYDMEGTCLGDWIEEKFQDELRKLDTDKFYGIRVYKDRIILDGACGFTSIERILKALGYGLKLVSYKSRETVYILYKI